MKILLVGRFLPERLDLSYQRAFRKLGCEVICFDMGDVNKFLRFCWEAIVNKKIRHVLDTFKPDLLLVMKGIYLWPRTLKEIEEVKKQLIFCFNTDNPFNLSSYVISNNNILDSIPYYDCYFTWSKLLIEPLLKIGAKKVEYLPFGFDSNLHHPIDVSCDEKKLYGNDIVFVGNWDKEREYWLKKLEDFDLGIWGRHYWNTRCKDKKLRRAWHRKAMYGRDMSKVLNASRISLNILRIQNKGSHNMRTFELPACGAFVLAERTQEAKEFFEEGKEAVYFSNPKELKEKAGYYLSHEQERKNISQAGYQRCLNSGYSYLDRAKRILKVYEELSR